MRINRFRWLGAGALLGAVCSTFNPVAAATATPSSVHWANLEIPFVANPGVFDPRVAFSASSAAGASFVTRDGQIVYRFERHLAEADPLELRAMVHDMTLNPRMQTGALPASALRQAVPAESTAITLSEKFVAARPITPAGQGLSATKVNYYQGADPAKWRTSAPAYSAVSLGEVWSGIDVALHARLRSVEKVFTVRPGADPAQIRMQVSGATALAVAANGQLMIRSGKTPVRLSKPIAWQQLDSGRSAVDVAYVVSGDSYGFRLGAYDRTQPLLIDPLIRATYAGGTDFETSDMDAAVDPQSGDVYIATRTFSPSFPGAPGGLNGGSDGLVLHVSADLSTVINATYIGGSGTDFNGLGAGAVVFGPKTGTVYVVNRTGSTDFPGTVGSLQPVNGGGGDGIVVRFSKTLTLMRASYLGGSNFEAIRGARVNPVGGYLYVLGYTYSTDLPGTAGSAQPALANPASATADVFIARFSPDLSTSLVATYLGGSGEDETFGGGIDFNATTGAVYVDGYTESTDLPATVGAAQPKLRGSPSLNTVAGSGNDCFVSSLTPNLAQIKRTTYLGGSGTEGARELLVHPATGEVYVSCTQTSSMDFPGTAGGLQPANNTVFAGILAKLNGDLTQIIQSTYLGGGGVRDLALDAATGDLIVAGETSEENMPGSANGMQNLVNLNGAGTVVDPFTGTLSFPADAFVARVSGDLKVLRQSTYYGGSGDESPFAICDVFIHPLNGSVYIFGDTASTDLPGTAGAFQPFTNGNTDTYIARMDASLTGPDTMPDAFALGSVGPVMLSTLMTSAPITVGGIAAPAAISIIGGSYSINGGAFTTYGGSVTNGDQVRVQHASAAASGQGVASTLTIGNVSATFTSTTGDGTPTPFSFAPKGSLATGKLVQSAVVTLAGVDVPVRATIIGGQLSVNGGPFFSEGGTVNNGDTLTLQVLTAATANTAVSATLSIGGISASFSAVTGATDTTPDAFSFTALLDVARSQEERSDFATVSGINTSVVAKVTSGEFSINGSGFSNLARRVNNGDRLQVRHTSAATPGTLTASVLTVGTISAEFDSTTAP